MRIQNVGAAHIQFLLHVKPLQDICGPQAQHFLMFLSALCWGMDVPHLF